MTVPAAHNPHIRVLNSPFNLRAHHVPGWEQAVQHKAVLGALAYQRIEDDPQWTTVDPDAAAQLAADVLRIADLCRYHSVPVSPEGVRLTVDSLQSQVRRAEFEIGDDWDAIRSVLRQELDDLRAVARMLGWHREEAA